MKQYRYLPDKHNSYYVSQYVKHKHWERLSVVYYAEEWRIRIIFIRIRIRNTGCTYDGSLPHLEKVRIPGGNVVSPLLLVLIILG